MLSLYCSLVSLIPEIAINLFVESKKDDFDLREEIFHRTVICKRNLGNKKTKMSLSLSIDTHMS